jgi:hypothetical protein
LTKKNILESNGKKPDYRMLGDDGACEFGMKGAKQELCPFGSHFMSGTLANTQTVLTRT